VVEAVRSAERDGFDAAIVDCTDDPGVVRARREATIPVIGPGESLQAAIERSPMPVVLLSGEQLRSSTIDDLVTLVADAGARTVALGGTGWSHLVARLADGGRVVLDPLDVALDRCLEQLGAGGQAG
jgi:Asp/Glu/hydantoin racemase